MIKKTGNKLLDEPRLSGNKPTILNPKAGDADFIEKLHILSDLIKHFDIKDFNDNGWMKLCFCLMDEFVPACQVPKKIGSIKSDDFQKIWIAGCYQDCLNKGFKQQQTMDCLKENGLLGSRSYAAIKKIKSRILKDKLFTGLASMLQKSKGFSPEEALVWFWEDKKNRVTN